jgi:hypothetical protein
MWGIVSFWMLLSLRRFIGRSFVFGIDLLAWFYSYLLWGYGLIVPVRYN